MDVQFNCYEIDSEGRDRPIVLTLRKESAGVAQNWRRHDCRSFQEPIVPKFVYEDEEIQIAFYIRQDGL